MIPAPTGLPVPAPAAGIASAPAPSGDRSPVATRRGDSSEPDPRATGRP